MAVAKYRKYFNEMFDAHREEFLLFKLLCDDYVKNRAEHKAEFDRQGKVIQEYVKDCEKRLCGHMEKGKNAVFSSKLADKFWEEVRAYFPPIDEVGVTMIFKKS